MNISERCSFGYCTWILKWPEKCLPLNRTCCSCLCCYRIFFSIRWRNFFNPYSLFFFDFSLLVHNLLSTRSSYAKVCGVFFRVSSAHSAWNSIWLWRQAFTSITPICTKLSFSKISGPQNHLSCKFKMCMRGIHLRCAKWKSLVQGGELNICILINCPFCQQNNCWDVLLGRKIYQI